VSSLKGLSIRHLRKGFASGGHAVLADVCLEIGPGETVALIGRSGAGKTTLARCIVGLEVADHGDVLVDGARYRPADRGARRAVQLVWQDPSGSLSPFRTLRQSVVEPLDGFGIGAPSTRARRAEELLTSVGVPFGMFDRAPHELSGGECQRAVLARALASDPGVLVLDEPMSALDPPRQAELSQVLARLTKESQRAILFISHDLTAVRRLSSRVALLDGGRIVDDVATPEFFARRGHPIARQFLEAWPPLPFS